MSTARRGNKETADTDQEAVRDLLMARDYKRLRRYAVDHELPDYQVAQKAIDDYLRDAA